MNVETLRDTVQKVLEDVKANGDAAVKAYEKQFDKVELEDLAVSEAEMNEAENLVSADLKSALQLAHDNILKFHAAQIFCPKKIGPISLNSFPFKVFEPGSNPNLFLITKYT